MQFSFCACIWYHYFADTSLLLAMVTKGLSEGSSTGKEVIIAMAGLFYNISNGHIIIMGPWILRI